MNKIQVGRQYYFKRLLFVRVDIKFKTKYRATYLEGRYTTEPTQAHGVRYVTNDRSLVWQPASHRQLSRKLDCHPNSFGPQGKAL